MQGICNSRLSLLLIYLYARDLCPCIPPRVWRGARSQARKRVASKLIAENDMVVVRGGRIMTKVTGCNDGKGHLMWFGETCGAWLGGNNPKSCGSCIDNFRVSPLWRLMKEQKSLVMVVGGPADEGPENVERVLWEHFCGERKMTVTVDAKRIEWGFESYRGAWCNRVENDVGAPRHFPPHSDRLVTPFLHIITSS